MVITKSPTRGSDKRGRVYKYWLEDEEYGNFITYGVGLTDEDVISEFEEFKRRKEENDS